MRISWQTETGQLACRWYLIGPVLHDQLRFQDDSKMQSGYLQPVPDFASHSPFGGAYWFQPIPLIGFFE